MGKNIIITGGARGIGRVTARHLLSSSAEHRVFLIDIDEAELTYCATVHLKDYQSRLNFAVTNLRDLEAIRRVVKQAAEWLGGRVDVVVNNAGIARPWWSSDRTMEDLEVAAEWQAFVETNLNAPFLVSQAVIPYMKNKAAKEADRTHLGGCIVHMSSFRAHRSEPNCEGYAATKAGLIGLTHASTYCRQPRFLI
jgi:NAD(P)-dependent dehydrogenase (short-subunit alcohol dehydrogenase family)